MHAIVVALAIASIQVAAAPQEIPDAFKRQELERRYYELAASGDRAALSEEWRANSQWVAFLIHTDLEKSLSLIEQARASGQEPDSAAVETLRARARLGAEAADAAFGTAIFTDCAVAFGSWSEADQARFRAREQSIRRAVADASQGKFENALAAAMESEELARSLGDWWGTAIGASQRGRALLALGRHEEAVAAYSDAVLLFHDLRLLGAEYLNLLLLADSLNAAGQRERERHTLERARALHEVLDSDGTHSALTERLQRLEQGAQVSTGK